MSYWTIGAAMTLASFAAAAGAASLGVALVLPAFERRLRARPPAARAASFFTLRVLPMATGLAAALAVVLPSYLSYEPADAQETLAVTLALAAAAGGLVVAQAAWRTVRAWRATRALAARWRLRARAIDCPGMPLPMFAIDERYPIVAVVGIRRPALFVADSVLRACTTAELRAMALHERAHVSARDNLKRLVLRACTGLLPLNRGLDVLWAEAAEESADAAAAAERPEAALDLAQALVRVARLAPSVAAEVPASAFYLGGCIDSRVRRLLDAAHAEPLRSSRTSRVAACLALIALVITPAAAFAPNVHSALERLLHVLP